MNLIKLQIARVELHIANFLQDNLLDLVAILLVLIPAGLLRLVSTDQPFLSIAHRFNRLLLALVTDLLGLEVTILLLYREREDVGKLLAIPVYVSLTNLNLDLSGNVVTSLSWFSAANHTLRSIAVVLGGFVPLAIELHGVCAGHVIDDLFLHVAIRCLHVRTLVVVLGGHVDLVGSVTDPVLPSETPLYLVSLL